MFAFRLAFGLAVANQFLTPTLGFTLPSYADDMAHVLAAQPSPSDTSTPSPRYDPRALDFFQISAEEDNELHSLDSTSDEDGHAGSIFGDSESSSDCMMLA